MTISAVDVLSEPMPEGYVLVNVCVIAAALNPETGDEHLLIRRDDDASAWKHVGMLTVALDDLRPDCQETQ